MPDFTKYARLDADNYAEFPPINSPDGRVINCNRNQAWLESQVPPYLERTEEWLEQHRRPQPEPVLPTVYTKRKIRLQMRQLGIEQNLNAVLQNAEFALDWAECQDIDLNNSEFQSAFLASGLTVEQLQQICERINQGGLDNVQ